MASRMAFAFSAAFLNALRGELLWPTFGRIKPEPQRARRRERKDAKNPRSKLSVLPEIPDSFRGGASPPEPGMC
jgi:hypothetical protein